MKILMVAIPNHHFFQWVNQLEAAGYDVHWFDITDGAGFSPKISWVKQYNGWKLKWNFPFRSTLKQHVPKLYKIIQNYNERKVTTVFEQLLEQLQPDVVHVFDMELTGIPLLEVLIQNKSIPLFYSSWGSDMFYFKERNISSNLVNSFLDRVNVMVSDCYRDIKLAKNYGLNKSALHFVFPGNGGISIPKQFIKLLCERNAIILKGYQFDVGEAIQIIKAIELIPVSVIQKFKIIVYSSDQEITDYIKDSDYFKYVDVEIFDRNIHVPNVKILEMMGQSIIHIANNVSDGMPNSLLEAMGMGAFPIQSNPGGVTEEVITHGENGFLILDCFDVDGISKLILEALNRSELRQQAQNYNTQFISDKYDRSKLKNSINLLYQSALNH